MFTPTNKLFKVIRNHTEPRLIHDGCVDEK